ncbi:hypothetical protein BDY24DRAFT_120691 [Mrakia frigida]|uniref:uncharacterized protein n=1 Tax=Mrakia frigida TaxID=29902 RepID=UPI003FCC15BF
MLEGMAGYWRQELVWEETKALLRKFPGIDQRTVEQKVERGGWNKCEFRFERNETSRRRTTTERTRLFRFAVGLWNTVLGQVRKDYGRWGWLGDQTLVSFLVLAFSSGLVSVSLTLPPLLFYNLWSNSIFAGFSPSYTHPSTRITAHLVSKERIESFFPPSSPVAVEKEGGGGGIGAAGGSESGGGEEIMAEFEGNGEGW